MSTNRFHGTTLDGQPTDRYVNEQIMKGVWREETIPPATSGLTRAITVVRARRASDLIVHDWHGDAETFCPPTWWDMAIGSGPCNLGCKNCFLLLTHRIRRDPWRHLLYDNLENFLHAAERWLADPARRAQHTLGLGIDRSDSLLYEGIAPHARNLAPLFGSSAYNRCGNQVILLTKSANTHYLQEIAPAHRHALVVSFSLNPQPVADLWEGEWPDTRERIPPTIAQRLEAARLAQDLGFEVRIRLDPIMTPDGWQEHYRAFIAEVQARGIWFNYWTLGTYRAKNAQLDAWRQRWGLLPMYWQPMEGEMVRDGTHLHLSPARRIEIYAIMRDLIRGEFPGARVSLCKETHTIRKALQLCNADCNCLITRPVLPGRQG